MSTDLSPSRAEPDRSRVDELLSIMTLEEKLAQLVGLWEGRDHGPGDADGDVAPMQDSMQTDHGGFSDFARHGLGQLTRVFGTTPVEPADGLARLAQRQRHLLSRTRLGIPALVHEECLTGLAAWRATTFPAPPSWGAAFHPELVEEMAAAIGGSMARLGVHQGLAPVLDVVRDARWGRVEECIGEDPYLVATIGTAYVRGLQSAGVDATLKHFVGYSNSRAGRNLAPVHAGPREIAEVLLPPFEMAVRDGGAASVMNSYAEIDGLPAAADAGLLTGLLRDRWGFTGTVVADYFSVAFLHTLHKVASDLGDAAAQALTAGIDVELPTGTGYLEPLAERVRSGAVAPQMVDRAVRRVLEQKQRLGLLDPAFVDRLPTGDVDLDPPGHRSLAARLAEESVILLGNDGILPLGADPGRIAVLGPNAEDPAALMGCYSFANHVLAQHPGVELGLDVATVLGALRTELPRAELVHRPGCGVDTDDTSGFDEAVRAAARADVAVAVLGDRAGLFGRGTSGEGCDTDTLELPGVQQQFLDALLDSGTPVVLVLLTGRPYVLDRALARCAAVVQAFFPGQEGGGAIAGVLSGRVNPSGRLPVSLPRSAGAQPYSYLHPSLGAASAVTSVETAPVRPFGFGLSYTRFEHSDLQVRTSRVPTAGAFTVSCRVRNTGDRAGADVVQLYGSDVVASVTRPVAALLGYARVELAAGETAEVVFDVPTRRVSLHDRGMCHVVEPGTVELFVGTSCADPVLRTSVELTGPVHEVRPDDRRVVEVEIRRSC
ncbi:beta-glucosidase [Pseudonocardia sp. KRD291]|uniref:beta-xylosidase/alpha-l-arabinosidase n=1 Tax=Pseudonocardia sp. KRD291 TaxID=2792007 RepID=UPI001C4A6654|nr:glycoside hydrolase family 3 N-terminal domain-containing protein [Pseudonocardia sp. KRD291]MBW0104117.1 glycoside hydrolase family 3 C-terminal domain-containing protein [Pseudonocardia sp. KRD291]